MPGPATWIIDPVGRAVLFVGDEARIGGLLAIALTYVENAGPLVQAGLAAAKSSGDTSRLDAAQRIASNHPLVDQWARDLRANDYPTLNSHSSVAIWGALECCIEDTITSIVVQDQAIHPKVLAILPKARMSAPATEEEARVVYHKLENHLRVQDDTVATYEAILQFFGLAAAVAIGIHQTLNELNAVRNCLLHRAGAVDSRARKHIRSPVIDAAGNIRLTSKDYQRYHNAVSEWLIALMTSTTTSSYYVPAT